MGPITPAPSAFPDNGPSSPIIVAPLSHVPVVGPAIHFVVDVWSNYTSKFLIMISFMYFFIKGLAYQALSNVQLPYYKSELKVSGDTYQRLYNVSNMAYAMKPIAGVISDTFPIRGLRKRPYMLVYCVLGTLSAVILALLKEKESNANVAAMLFFINTMCVASLDLLCEAKYSELMVTKGKSGPKIVTWVWLCFMVGATIAAAIEGPISDEVNARVVLWVCAPFFIPLLICLLSGCMPESASDAATGGGVVTAVAAHHKGLLVLGICLSISALINAVLQLFTNNVTVIVFTVIIAIVLASGLFKVLPSIIAKVVIFGMLREACYIQIDGILSYWYTSGAPCSDGPDFSYTYYQTLTNILGSFSGFCGVIIFQRFLTTRTFQSVFYVTTTIKILGSLFDLIMVKRWNIDMHIPDKAMFVFGDAIIQQATQMMDFMPSAVLMSRMCPKGMESTVFALLSGFSNFGTVMSRTVGYMLAEALGVDSSSSTCDYSNLPALIVLCHVVSPLLIIPLSQLLVPRIPINNHTEQTLDEGPPRGESSSTSYGTPAASEETELATKLIFSSQPDTEE